MGLTASEASLLVRLRWLISLRWVAAAGVLGLSALSAQMLRFPIALFALQALGILIAVYNLLLREALGPRHLPRPGGSTPYLLLCANLQIGLDLLALTLVIHFTGGLESPLSLFYVFHMIIASMLLTAPAAFAQATVAFVSYLVTLALEARGLIGHYSLGIAMTGDAYRSPQAWPLVLALGAALYVAVFLASSIAGELRRREAQMADLTRELAQQAQSCHLAYAGLEETQRSQVEYMRRIAHELKSPLSAICMMLKAILGTSSSCLPPRQQDMMTRADARAKAALDLTEDLLTLSEIREAHDAEAPSEVSLAHLVESVVAEEEVLAREQGLALVAEIQAGLPLVRGYQSELIALVRNLLSNATRHSHSGGRVWLRAYQDQEQVVLQVQDEGIGIPADELDRIFEEFYRSSASRKAGIPGTGLGLAIVRSILEHHQAQISVDSEPGRGSTFTVRLPRA
ncbi:MAG: sensor histidine kinase [Armatimonadia bacterium]